MATDRDLGHALGHQRFHPVLLPPAADEDVFADAADDELSGRGLASGAELDDEEVAVGDALVVHAVASGAEDGPVHLGSFDRWASVVSGILDCSGIEGLLDNRKEFLDSASDDTGMFVGVVHQWAGQWPDQEVRAADLLTLPAMEELLDVHSSTANIRLGKLIKPFLNRVVGGFTLKRRTKDGVSLYSLEKDQS